MQLSTELGKAFAEAYNTYFSAFSEYNKSWKDPLELDKSLRSKFRKVFDEIFRQEKFVHTLSDTVAGYSELAKITGIGKIYQHLSNRLSVWNNDFVEPVRDTVYRTPSKKITELEKYSLFRYDRPVASARTATSTKKEDQAINQRDEKQRSSSSYSPPPVLVIYAFINRHYILDLLPEVSVVRNLLNQGGLDVLQQIGEHHLHMTRV
jgi:poly[(R)-3-hydroxyalkanoate] polymerase subunit PhaC